MLSDESVQEVTKLHVVCHRSPNKNQMTDRRETEGESDGGRENDTKIIQDVVVTENARLKSYRMHSSAQLTAKITEMDGDALFRKGRTNEYHLDTRLGTGNNTEHIIIAFVVEGDTIVITTQMHRHLDYHESEAFQQVGGINKTDVE